jgi:hypothetical protein
MPENIRALLDEFGGYKWEDGYWTHPGDGAQEVAEQEEARKVKAKIVAHIGKNYHLSPWEIIIIMPQHVLIVIQNIKGLSNSKKRTPPSNAIPGMCG